MEKDTTVMLAGNPDSGKTTVFWITKSSQYKVDQNEFLEEIV